MAQWIVVTEIMKTTKNWGRGCTVVSPEWLPDIVPNLCKFGEPFVDSYKFGEATAMVKKPIIFKGQSVGETRAEVGAGEAEKIQKARIKNAEAEGLTPLTFFERPGVYAFLNELVANYKGSEYKSWVSDVKPGETYYCELEDFVGRKYAKPAFQVFRFGEAEKENKKENSPKPLDLSKLADKWGAKIK